MDEKNASFYDTYASYKGYVTPTLSAKDTKRFDAEIWEPGGFRSEHAVLEIGCGTGLLMSYFKIKGVFRLVGIDHDPALVSIIPEIVRDHFRGGDVRSILADPDIGRFERVVLMDVLEHFSPAEALALLRSVRSIMTDDGSILIKVPNASSPWGLNYQYGDLTHRTAFNPLSMRQLADAAGFDCRCYPQNQGSRRRRLTDALVHRFLRWALLTPPDIFSANFYARLDIRD